jgi:hypothetical protein
MRALLMIGLSVVLSAQAAPRRVSPDGALLAASEGGGQVRLLIWPPMKAPMPAGGWQVQDGSGRVLVPVLKAGDPEALKALPPEEALEASKMIGEILAEKDEGKRRMLTLNALVEGGNRPGFGRAMGLACALAGQPLGRRAYTVVGLDASGKVTGPRLASAELDPGLPSPLPQAPVGLRAEAGKESVRLFWPPVDGGDIPIVDYRIQRGEQVLTQRPNILGIWDPAVAAFEDREAPGDQASEYRVWAVDVFGRRGPDAAVGIFFPDPATLRPPTELSVRSDAGVNRLSFKPSPTPRSAGILVERALASTGPFELITPKPLAPATTNFSDGTVGGGATYYYRLRVVDADGNVGGPGATGYVIARSKARPEAPAGLAVKASPLGNVLTWQLPETPLAGFLVERRLGEGVWTRLGKGLVQGGRVEDLLTDDVSGALNYRVSAITFDNLVSDPCEAVSVVRENLTPPQPPVIQDADGADGRVRLRFRPAAPEERTAQILVLRALRRVDESKGVQYGLELVIGDPLPSSARDFTDVWVDPGETYRYRLVAISPEGVRSPLAEGVEMRVSPPSIPEPPVAALRLVETPFRHVQVKLAAIPEGFRAFLHRKAAGETVWTEVQGPFQDLEVVDPRPVSGRVQYRIHLEDSRGLTGRSGQSVELVIP